MTGKKYIESSKLIDKSKLYDASEAVALVCQTAKAKFDETVELHVRLGVDSRHADQQVRGAIVLPNGTGKTVRTLVIIGVEEAICGFVCRTLKRHRFFGRTRDNIGIFCNRFSRKVRHRNGRNLIVCNTAAVVVMRVYAEFFSSFVHTADKRLLTSSAHKFSQRNRRGACGICNHNTHYFVNGVNRVVV